MHALHLKRVIKYKIIIFTTTVCTIKQSDKNGARDVLLTVTACTQPFYIHEGHFKPLKHLFYSHMGFYCGTQPLHYYLYFMCTVYLRLD